MNGDRKWYLGNKRWHWGSSSVREAQQRSYVKKVSADLDAAAAARNRLFGLAGKVQEEAANIRACEVPEMPDGMAASVQASIDSVSQSIYHQGAEIAEVAHNLDRRMQILIQDANAALREKSPWQDLSGLIDKHGHFLDYVPFTPGMPLPGVKIPGFDNSDYTRGFVEGLGGMCETADFLGRLTGPGKQIDAFLGNRSGDQMLVDGGRYALKNPRKVVREAFSLDLLRRGEYSRWAGRIAPDVILTILTDGGATAAKVSGHSASIAAKRAARASSRRKVAESKLDLAEKEQLYNDLTSSQKLKSEQDPGPPGGRYRNEGWEEMGLFVPIRGW